MPKEFRRENKHPNLNTLSVNNLFIIFKHFKKSESENVKKANIPMKTKNKQHKPIEKRQVYVYIVTHYFDDENTVDNTTPKDEYLMQLFLFLFSLVLLFSWDFVAFHLVVIAVVFYLFILCLIGNAYYIKYPL